MQFTHDHEQIRDTLKRYIDEHINPHVDEWEEAGIFPAHQVFKGLGDLGLLGLTKPEAYGGAGLDYSYGMVMAETLGHINCGGVPMAIGVQTDMCTPAPGSLTPMQPTVSPAMAGMRNSFRRAWLQKRASAGVHMSVCTPNAICTPPQLMGPSVSAMTMP